MRRKIYFLLSIVILIFIGLFVLVSTSGLQGVLALPGGTEPGPTLVWNVTWGTTAQEWGGEIAQDNSGFVYQLGYSYESGDANTNLLKYAPNGTFIWNISWGGADDDSGADITSDVLGNLYCVGSTLSFGGFYEAFVFKVFPNGTVDWFDIWGGAQGEEGYGVAVDNGAGCIYVVGYTFTFGQGGESDAFIQQYYFNGTQGWNVTWGYAATPDWAKAVAVDGAGNVYVTGWSDAGSGNLNVFLTKFLPSGTSDWTEYWSSTGSNDEAGQAIIADSSSNIYIAGDTDEGTDIDNGLLAKYNTGGTKQWDEVRYGTGSHQNWDTTLDATGNVYVAGISDSEGAGGGDAYFFMMKPNKVLGWREVWGGTTEDRGKGIIIDGVYLYLGGRTTSPGYTQGGGDFFLAKYKLNFRPNPPPLIPGFTLLSVLGALAATFLFYFGYRRQRMTTIKNEETST